MAKPRLTSAPSSTVDVTAPLRSYLGDISSKYGKIDQLQDAEKERALERDIADKRYAAEQARLLDKDQYSQYRDTVSDAYKKYELDEDAKRFDAMQALRLSQEQRQQEKAAQDKVVADRQTKAYDEAQKVKSIFKTYDPSSITFEDISTYTPGVAKKIENAAGNSIIGKQLELTEEIFNPTTSPTRRAELANQYVAQTEKYYGKEFTPQQREALSDRVLKLGTQVNVPTDDDLRAKAMSDAYSILGLDAAQKSRDEFFNNAPSLLTKDEARSIHVRKLQAQGVPRAEALAEADAIVTANFARDWEKDILARRQSAADLENKYQTDLLAANKDYLKFQLDIIDDLSSGTSTKYKSTGNYAKDITTLLKEGGVHDNVDEDETRQLVERYKTLAQEFPADVAMAATIASFKPGFILDEVGDLASARQFALDIQGLGKAKANKNKGLIDKARANLSANLSRDLLTPPRPRGANMDAWRATRWGQRSALPLPKLIP
jgi:hypothetical protein